MFNETTTIADIEEMFEANFNEIEGDVVIGGSRYSAAEVLKESDPIAYRSEFNDYCEYLLGSGLNEEEYNILHDLIG